MTVNEMIEILNGFKEQGYGELPLIQMIEHENNDNCYELYYGTPKLKVGSNLNFSVFGVQSIEYSKLEPNCVDISNWL